MSLPLAVRWMRNHRQSSIDREVLLFERVFGWPPYPRPCSVQAANAMGLHPELYIGENWSERYYIEHTLGVDLGGEVLRMGEDGSPIIYWLEDESGDDGLDGD